MYDLELLKEAIIRADNGIDFISIDLDLKLLKNSVLDDMILAGKIKPIFNFKMKKDGIKLLNIIKLDLSKIEENLINEIQESLTVIANDINTFHYKILFTLVSGGIEYLLVKWENLNGYTLHDNFNYNLKSIDLTDFIKDELYLFKNLEELIDIVDPLYLDDFINKFSLKIY